MTIKLPEGKIYGFLKFTKYGQKLLDGQIYMNSLGYYLDEDKHGVGRGDANEGSLLLNGGIAQFTNLETGETVQIENIDNVKIIDKKVLNQPVYCLLALDCNTLRYYGETEDDYIFRIKDDYIQDLIQDFGTNEVVFLEAKRFIDKLTKKLSEEKLAFIGDSVKYSDNNYNFTDRITTWFDNNDGMCFLKDIKYKHQNEWRLLIQEKTKTNTPLKLEIGDLSDCAIKTTAENLIEGMEYRFSKVEN